MMSTWQQMEVGSQGSKLLALKHRWNPALSRSILLRFPKAAAQRAGKFQALPTFALVVVVQSLRCVRLFATPWTAAHQASLSSTFYWNLLKLMSVESMMSSNYLILSCPLLLPSIFPRIRVFSNGSALHIRWPKSIGVSVQD